MIVVDGTGTRPPHDQITDLASVCPPGLWSCQPIDSHRLRR